MKRDIKREIKVIAATLRSAPVENGRKSARLIKELKQEDLQGAAEALACIKTAVDLRCTPQAVESFEKAFFEEWERH